MADSMVAPAERTLPHNLEAERSVLGAILVQNDAFNLAAQVIKGEDFYRDAHRRIFDGMAALSERSHAIDFVTLKEELSRSGNLDDVGGPAYVASLADGVPRATNVEYYAKIVKEKATLRNLIYAANKIVADAYGAEQESDLILDEAERSIFAVAEDRLKAGFVEMRDLVKENFPKIEQLFEQKRLITGVPTGFADLDGMTRGLQPGDLVIVAARPSMGKTSLVLNIAQHVAAQPDLTVGFFSLEMSKESLFLRMLTSEAHIDSHRLMSGAIGQKDYGRIAHALETLSNMRLHIDDTAGIGVMEMRAKSRRLQAEHGLQPAGGGLYPADDRARPLREPHPRARVDLALDQGARQGAQRPDHRAVAVEPRARGALGSSPAALGPSRVRDRRYAGMPHRRPPRADLLARRADSVGLGDDRGRAAHRRRRPTKYGRSASAQCRGSGLPVGGRLRPRLSTGCWLAAAGSAQER